MNVSTIVAFVVVVAAAAFLIGPAVWRRTRGASTGRHRPGTIHVPYEPSPAERAAEVARARVDESSNHYRTALDAMSGDALRGEDTDTDTEEGTP